VLDLVIVVSDLFVSQETPERELPDGVTLPGLQHLARFGTRSKTAGGWRPWLARWLTGQDVGSPATVAAIALAPHSIPRATPLRDAATAAGVRSGSAPLQSAAAPAHRSALPTPLMVWMATPVHLVAGLTSLHLDRRSILRLGAEESATLAAEFHRVFDDSGFELQPLDSGDFLLFGPQLPLTETSEPARAMGASIADAQRASAVDPTLRRLGAEVEMWLHSHAINDARQGRGELPVTGLWFWGAGSEPTASVGTDETSNIVAEVRAAPDAAPADTDIAFGSDAYLRGLWSSRGEKVFPLPRQLTGVFSYPHARRAVLVIEIGSTLNSNPTWTFFDAVTQIDRTFISPAVDALSQGKYQRLVMLANDHQWTLRARDRLKFWRRAPAGLSGLQ
jgi:hypothetical protein